MRTTERNGTTISQPHGKVQYVAPTQAAGCIGPSELPCNACEAGCGAVRQVVCRCESPCDTRTVVRMVTRKAGPELNRKAICKMAAKLAYKVNRMGRCKVVRSLGAIRRVICRVGVTLRQLQACWHANDLANDLANCRSLTCKDSNGVATHRRILQSLRRRSPLPRPLCTRI